MLYNYTIVVIILIVVAVIGAVALVGYFWIQFLKGNPHRVGTTTTSGSRTGVIRLEPVSRTV